MKNSPGLRPLPLHLVNAQLCWGGAALGAHHWISDTVPWHPDLAEESAALKAKLCDTDPALLVSTIGQEAAQRLQDLLAGISQYLAHPYRRGPSMAQPVATVGSARLLDYGGPGRPVLLVPSLINPSDILDLMPGRSFAAHLMAAGWRPLLVDWGTPDRVECDVDLEQVIMERLVPLIATASKRAGGALPVLGYCMGGTLALAAAQSCAAHISALALLASPFDFTAMQGGTASSAVMRAVIAAIPEGGSASVDIIQLYFTSLDPSLNDRKFRRFAKMDPDSDAATFFVALESWANAGAPLPRRVAMDCLDHWYEGNRLAAGTWRVDGTAVDPAQLDYPVFVVAPKTDRLVPPSSALAILPYLKQAVVHEPDAGHVGMMVGAGAADALWHPITKFLEACHAA